MATIYLPNVDAKALIDDEDIPLVTPYRWYGMRNTTKRSGTRIYVWAHGPNPGTNWKDDRRPIILMGRLILGLTDSKIFADHIDGNPLNNCRSNLRPATRHQNRMNGEGWGKSGIKGVWQISGGRWEAAIRSNRTLFNLGKFATAEEAMAAYDAAAREHFGEFAFTHFPEPRPFTRLN